MLSIRQPSNDGPGRMISKPQVFCFYSAAPGHEGATSTNQGPNPGGGRSLGPFSGMGARVPNFNILPQLSWVPELSPSIRRLLGFPHNEAYFGLLKADYLGTQNGGSMEQGSWGTH